MTILVIYILLLLRYTQIITFLRQTCLVILYPHLDAHLIFESMNNSWISLEDDDTLTVQKQSMFSITHKFLITSPLVSHFVKADYFM